MTVGELKKQLAKYDDSLEIVLSVEDLEWGVEMAELGADENNKNVCVLVAEL
jgi:hypothetical protein